MYILYKDIKMCTYCIKMRRLIILETVFDVSIVSLNVRQFESRKKRLY